MPNEKKRTPKVEVSELALQRKSNLMEFAGTELVSFSKNSEVFRHLAFCCFFDTFPLSTHFRITKFPQPTVIKYCKYKALRQLEVARKHSLLCTRAPRQCKFLHCPNFSQPTHCYQDTCISCRWNEGKAVGPTKISTSTFATL